MANHISTPVRQNCSIINMENEKERLVNREVLCNVSYLVTELMSQEKYLEELSELIGQQDDEGNIPEVYEYWAITPWLGEKLIAYGELVTEFFDLVIWGRQITGQLISCDSVIEGITKQLFAS